MTDAPPDDDALARYIEAAAPLLGLRIDPAWGEDVLGYFKGMATAARLVAEFEMSDHADPAPVFSA